MTKTVPNAVTKTVQSHVEWPTFSLLIGCYVVWAIATVWLVQIWLPLAIVVAGFALALHSSLQHEVLHGHPFRSQKLSEAMVFPAIGLFVPYLRFRDSHLEHHRDSRLTDPYDDPESNYLDPKVWAGLATWKKLVLNFNNTLLGRMLIGPLVAQQVFMAADWRAVRGGNRAVLAGWLWHVPGLAFPVLWLAYVSDMPVWAYVISAYMGLSLLKIRTYLEHRAHERSSGRTVIIEDRGLLSYLFLNNNYHVVHHMHPAVPWYQLPGLFRKNREHYLARNDGYYYPSYRAIFRAHLLHRKDQVAHPIWQAPRQG